MVKKEEINPIELNKIIVIALREEIEELFQEINASKKKIETLLKEIDYVNKRLDKEVKNEDPTP